MVLLIVAFSLALPTSFPTFLNLQTAPAGEKSVIALLSLAAMIPMMTGRIDLTVGYGIVIWHVLAISLQTIYGLPWGAAVLIVLVGGCLLGLVNGLLVKWRGSTASSPRLARAP